VLNPSTASQRFADRFSLSMTDRFEHVFELDMIDPID
jgi:hypothetical protein